MMTFAELVASGDRSVTCFLAAVSEYRKAVTLGQDGEDWRRVAHDNVDAFLDALAMVVRGTHGEG